MPANNNTRGLSDKSQLNMSGYIPGTIGQRQFSDFNATEISGAISRSNFREQIKYDKKLNDFREAVYKIVQGYAYEDKLNIITEYGDYSQLNGKNLDEDDINQICTESMIIHLDPGTLKQLVADMGMKEQILKRSVKEDMKRRRVFTGFNTDTFEDIYKQIKDMKKNNYEKNINVVDKSYKVPRYLKNQYPKLRKELRDVLQTCYNKIDIARLAREMDISTPAGTSYKELYNWIINKTILYVSLIIGRSNIADVANSIINPAPFEELLMYTSYSYVTGKPGLDPDAWSQKREEARRAKKAIKERMKMQRDRVNIFSNLTMSDEFASITGGVRGRRRTGIGSIAKKFKYNDTGILSNASYDDLIALAGRYGIDPTKKRGDIGILKSEIYAAIADEAKRTGKLNKKKDNMVLGPGKTKRNVFDLLSVHGMSTDISKGQPILDINDSTDSNLNSDSVPIINLHRDGTVRTKQILSAVPVYIIGQSIGGDTRTQEEINENNNKIEKIKDIRKNRKITRGNENIIGLIDINMDKDDLNEKERRILSYFEKLTPDGNRLIDGSKPVEGLENLQKVKYFLIKSYDAPAKIFNFDKDKNLKDIDKQLRYCWLYAKATGCNKLAAYITKQYGIIFRVKFKKSKLKQIGGGLIAGSSGLLGASLSSVAGGIPGAILAGIGALAGGVFKLFKGRNSANSKKTIESSEEQLKEIATTKSLTDTTPTNSLLAIPKINVASGKVSSSDIIEAVPVFIVNSNIFSIPQPQNKYENGIGKNTDLATNINAKNGIVTKGDNSVYISDANRIQTLAAARGIKLTSEIFNTKNKNYDKKYKNLRDQYAKLTTEDLENLNKSGIIIGKGSDLGKLNGPIKTINSGFTEFAKKKQINKIISIPAIPVVNIEAKSISILETIKNDIEGFRNDYLTQFSDFKTALGAGFQIAAPMGVGTAVFSALAVNGLKDKLLNSAANVAQIAMDSLKEKYGLYNSPVANTGGKITRFATGGTSAIVGDSAGSNIFRNGAKPELVQSTGNMTVTPLNKTGTESQKINRMTTSERKQALATAISSHIIKYTYNLPQGATEVSNATEAIKVFNVKPGITDEIIVNNTTTTLAEMIMAIYNQLVANGTISATNSQLLTSIASNTANQIQSVQSGSSQSISGFTSSLDGILGGE